jgi:cytoskeletal protein CcmA (bactofilin family)
MLEDLIQSHPSKRGWLSAAAGAVVERNHSSSGVVRNLPPRIFPDSSKKIKQTTMMRVTFPGHAKHEHKIMDPNINTKNALASDVEIKGNLKFTGELSFDGKLDGEIQTEGVLTLGDTAVINGNINAQSVVVRGKVTGNINAKEKVEIKAKAELFGDIRATKLVIEEGVTYVGKTEVNPNKASPTAPPRTAEPPKLPEPAGKPPGR